jgi:hypothetical protein
MTMQATIFQSRRQHKYSIDPITGILQFAGLRQVFVTRFSRSLERRFSVESSYRAA